jgi:glycosyltransferase involved in cell wall biosynthesis
MCKLSVITINFNNLVGLVKTVESVFNQTWRDFEYIVIDGGSSDGSFDFLNEKSSLFTYWKSEPDKGIYNAMNKGILAARGEYLLFLNSGDHFFNNNVLSMCIKYLNGTDLVIGDLNYVKLGMSYSYEYPTKVNINWVYKYSLPHPSTFIRKNLFEVTGYYNEGDKISSDWQFFMIALFKFNSSFLKINQIVSSFYANGISHDESSISIIEYEKNAFMNNNFSQLELELLHFNSILINLLNKRIVKLLFKIPIIKSLIGSDISFLNNFNVFIRKL